MKKYFILTSLLFSLLSVSVSAQTDSTHTVAKTHQVKALTPAEKKAMRQEMKKKWDSMTPEQKEATREGIKAARERYQNMTPEEKAAAQEKMRDLKKRYDSLPPEEREKIKQQIAERRKQNDSTSFKHKQ